MRGPVSLERLEDILLGLKGHGNKGEDTTVTQMHTRSIKAPRDGWSTAIHTSMAEPWKNIHMEIQLPTDMGSVLQADRIATIRQYMASKDPDIVLKATEELREMLSVEKDPPVQEVVAAGMVPLLIEHLGVHNNPPLQFAAAWALTNITAGSSDQTRTVIDRVGLPVLMDLMNSKDDNILEQVVLTLGNIAGDSCELRDLVLESGGLQLLTPTLHPQKNSVLLQTAVWTLLNFCRGKPPPKRELIADAFPLLRDLMSVKQTKVLEDACWAVSCLMSAYIEFVTAAVEAGMVEKIVRLLSRKSVQTPALRIIATIALGENSTSKRYFRAMS